MKPQLQALADEMLAGFGVNPATWPLTDLVYVGFMVAAASLAFGFAVQFSGLFIFFERRIAGRMQARVGPNRVGPNGLLQFLTDGLKCLFKEDLIPEDADKPLFRLAPYFVVVGMVLAFACLPFSSNLIPADLNIGILYILGITALVAIGVLMSGWGSNSKWALLGGMRAAAQVISYEIPAALAAMVPIILAGSLSMQDLIKVQGGGLAQGGGVWNWTIFHSPMAAVSFVIFFVAQLAEGNRTPFDLPEAESELVSGYNTEYSGMRFLMFFLGEFANVWILCALPVALYFGGWQIPFGTQTDGITPAAWVVGGSSAIMLVLLVGASLPAVAIGAGIFKYRVAARSALDRARFPGMWPDGTRAILKLALDGAAALHILGAFTLVGLGFWQLSLESSTLVAIRNSVAINGLQLGIFLAKTLALVFVVIQLRWTLPRVRMDQMMSLCWKYLVPVSFACIVLTLGWELVIQTFGSFGFMLQTVVRIAMACGLVFLVALYVKRVKWNYEVTQEKWEGFKGEPQYFPPWKLP